MGTPNPLPQCAYRRTFTLGAEQCLMVWLISSLAFTFSTNACKALAWPCVTQDTSLRLYHFYWWHIVWGKWDKGRPDPALNESERPGKQDLLIGLMTPSQVGRICACLQDCVACSGRLLSPLQLRDVVP